MHVKYKKQTPMPKQLIKRSSAEMQMRLFWASSLMMTGVTQQLQQLSLALSDSYTRFPGSPAAVAVTSTASPSVGGRYMTEETYVCGAKCQENKHTQTLREVVSAESLK